MHGISKQLRRGQFAWWSEEKERLWKQMAPDCASPPPKFPLSAFARNPIRTRVRPNSTAPAIETGKFSSFDAILESGRSYLVGESMPMDQFIRRHRSALTAWQKAAWQWAKANPFYRLELTIGNREWEVYARGEYVELTLPHHGKGGEKHYVSNNGRSKILVNVD